ncbi:hypothetical protein [Demequina sp.]|uniref:hypothetical protein n=1 Tax=Demequina sp. TaxID=2050685 RepID=UPI003A8B6C4A
MCQSHPFPQADALAVSTGLIADLARRGQVRVLTLKGRVSDHHAIRSPRTSADADVWVDPSRLNAYLAELAACGWHERELSDTVHDLVQHSTTLIHPDWPCDIDVHWTFPGFLGDPQEVFDELWRRHTTMEIAAVEVPIVDRSAAILIQALHALRTPAQTGRHAQEFRYLIDNVIPKMGAPERQDLIDLAVATGAVDTARPLLSQLGLELPPPTPSGVNPDLDRWRERTAGQGALTSQYWILIRRSPWKDRPRLLARGIWPPERDLRLDHPEVAPGSRALTRARLARLGRGARAFPAALRAQWRAKRGLTEESFLKREGDKE